MDDSNEHIFLHVDRVEVIDSTGRAFVAYYRTNSGVSVSIQDGGRTLKVFAETPLKGNRRAPYSRCGAVNPRTNWICEREPHEGGRHWEFTWDNQKLDWVDDREH